MVFIRFSRTYVTYIPIKLKFFLIIKKVEACLFED